MIGQSVESCQSLSIHAQLLILFTSGGSSCGNVVLSRRPIVRGQRSRDGKGGLLVLCRQRDLVAAIVNEVERNFIDDGFQSLKVK